MTAIVDDLNLLLADLQVHYQRLRNYHWNVTGPQFFELHMKFEELYNAAALHVDEVAERVLALRGRPLSTLRSQIAAARLQEDAEDLRPTAAEMVERIMADMQALGGQMRCTVAAANDVNDAATANLLEPMADEYEKTAWMLRASMA
jgi:starvation-inducible DNA-binding protein